MANSKISALTSATTPLAGTETLPIVQSSTTKQVSVANLTAGRDVTGLSFTGGNVKISGNTVTTTDTNGNLTLDPNGSGYTIVAAPTNGTIAQMGNLSSRTFYLKQSNFGGYDNDTLIFESDSGVGQFQWKNSGGVLSTLSYTGNYTLSTGNLVIGTSGKGIDFSATPGTGTSELFADYEEGAWTPSLTSAGGNFTTINYGDQQGSYTKIGRMVKVRGNLFTSGAITAGAASGQVYIAGLPFTASVSDVGNIWFNPDSANYNMPLALATGLLVITTSLRLFKNGTVNNPSFNVTDLYVLGGPANNMFFEATYMV